MKNNKIHIYCGDGKGKTSACIGLAVRAAGAGFNVVFVQFLKGKTSSELNILQNISNIKIISTDLSNKFTFQMTAEELETAKNKQNELLSKAIEECKVNSDKNYLLILDEVFGALSTNTLSKELVMQAINNLQAEIVLTGRNPSLEFIDAANYVSEIKKVKHPFDEGLQARKGIEF